MSRREIIAILAAISITNYPLTGCGSKAARDITAGTQQQSYGKSTVINFDKTSNAVTANDKDKIRDMINAVGANNIERIEVAVWSDKEFPKQNFDLPDEDRELADQRATQLERFLKNELMVPANVNTYNMAETSNWISRTMRTNDAELKSVFEGNKAPLARAEFDTIGRDGGPSKAVIVVVTKK
jgi:hypothetical protein